MSGLPDGYTLSPRAVCMYTRTYIYTYIHTYIHTHTYCMHTYIHACMQIYILTYIHHMYMHAYLHTHVKTWLCKIHSYFNARASEGILCKVTKLNSYQRQEIWKHALSPGVLTHLRLHSGSFYIRQLAITSYMC